MTLRDTYSRFLATPSTGALAENASLHYVSTTTSIQDATAIIKHLSVQEKLLKKKKQNILDAVEGSRALTVDVETTVEFINGGGAYLPGLDDNFVADRTATFPMVCTNLRPRPWRTSLTLTPTGPHRPLRPLRQDHADSPILGPGLAPQTARRHWCAVAQLAYSRRQRTAPLDICQCRCFSA
jgi:hypothetical protein